MSLTERDLLDLTERDLLEMMLRKIENGDPTDDESIRFWNSRSAEEKLAATAELTRRHYLREGVDKTQFR